jgi:chemotaxis protein MotA
MDLAVIIGVVLGFGALFGANIMEGGDPTAIFLAPPMILVFGGTLAAAMTGGVMKDTIGIVASLKKAFTSKVTPSTDVVETVVSLAKRARREGLLALEDAAKDIDDEFLREGLQLAVDGGDPDDVRMVLESKIDAKRTADKAGAKIFADMGGYAPTIGIIGTVFGLVHVLENLSEPEKLGHLIAAAFVATLWGVLTANLLWLPLANRLKRLSELECARMELVVEGVAAIQAGANPRAVQQRLTSLLPPDTAEPKAA